MIRQSNIMVMGLRLTVSLVTPVLYYLAILRNSDLLFFCVPVPFPLSVLQLIGLLGL